MTWITRTRVKYALAGAGALYLVLFFGYLVYAGTRPATPTGPSELEAHPEKQAEIVSRRRAEELRDQLQLSEEQTQKIAAIYFKYESNQSANGDPRDRWRAQREEIEKVLTPEQKALWEQMRGQFRGPGGPDVFSGPGGMRGPGGPGTVAGPRGQITPERIEQLKQSMTPEQRERFEKAAQRMQQMRGQGGQRGGQRGGPRGDGQGRGRSPGQDGQPPRH
jgi:Spy/CpxP family protein refolding chaperone